MRPRRKLSEDEQRQKTLKEGNLAAFSQHPSWPDLKQAILDREDEIRRSVLADAFSRSKPINQRELDFRHGVIQGMRYMVKVCEGAEHSMERLLKEQSPTSEGSM